MVAQPRKLAWQRGLLVIGLLCFAIWGVGEAVAIIDGRNPETAISGNPAGVDRKVDLQAQSDDSTTKFAVTIRKPSGPPRVETGFSDLHGNKVTVACSTCHTIRPPNYQNKVASDLDEFHRGMTFSHGTVSCLSCHNDRNYDALKLADGSRVEFTDVMTLCAQCHGPQMTAYTHGAHGGMTGYWDLSRGPHLKNNCIDCHNPHSPQFPKMQPTFKPQDRFLDPPRTKH